MPRSVIAFALLALVGCSARIAGGGTPPTAKDDGKFAVLLGDGFQSDGSFDPRMTCDGGGDFSPPLIFRQVPRRTVELVLSMVDEDKLSVHGDPLIHWVEWRISPTEPGLLEHTKPDSAREARNDLDEATYDGPCPPAGQTHHYRFTLLALSEPLDLPYGTPAREVLAVASPSAIATRTVVATYRR